MAEAREPLRLGFLGLGWIGRHRMRALADDPHVIIAALADPALNGEARELAPGAAVCRNLDELLASELDGLVIATPSALHAEQSIAALQRGLPVFCQKPLARSAAEARGVIDRARTADRLLGVDFSYRFLTGIRRIKARIEAGDLGDIYAGSLAFHNAYGPDKPWFYRRRSSGGGCVADLGIHLIDLALWLLDFPAVERVASRCYAQGRSLSEPPGDEVEDYATIRLELAGGTSLDLACSWRLAIGRDCDIQIALYGTRGGASLRNVNGSFYDFRAELYHGTDTETLCDTANEGAWGGRAALDWARRLAADRRFDAHINEAATVADVVDAVYSDGGK